MIKLKNILLEVFHKKEKRIKILQGELEKKRKSAPGKNNLEKNDWLRKNDPAYTKLANALMALTSVNQMHPDTIKSNFDIDRYYIRFGDLPEGGKSYNFLYKRPERGVSAYEAKWNTEFNKWEIIQDTLNGEGMASLIELFSLMSDEKSKRPVYLLHGKETENVGNDGEPLLDPDMVKVLKRLEPHEFFATEVGPDWHTSI